MSRQQRVKFIREGIEFKGTLYEPDHLENCKGIIIFTHGLGYCERQYKMDWNFFPNNGYVLFTYNLRGHAGNEGVWTLSACVQDLIEIISFLINHYHFKNKTNIITLGHSTGALITLLTILKDKRIKVGIAVTTVTCLTHSFLYWFHSGFNQDVKAYFSSKGVLPPIINQFMDDPGMLELYYKKLIPANELDIPHRYGMLKSRSWNEFFHEIAYSVDLIDYSKDMDIPLLLVRGKNDEVMDPKKTDLFHDRIRLTTHSKLLITASQNHFQNGQWDMIQNEALNFIDSYRIDDPQSSKTACSKNYQ